MSWTNGQRIAIIGPVSDKITSLLVDIMPAGLPTTLAKQEREGKIQS